MPAMPAHEVDTIASFSQLLSLASSIYLDISRDIRLLQLSFLRAQALEIQGMLPSADHTGLHAAHGLTS